jgi:hypothetical protein
MEVKVLKGGKSMKKLFTVLLTMIFMLMPAAVFADSEVAPHSYKEAVANNKFVFVMIYPGSPEVKTEDGKVYTRTGLYKNDNSIEPLWTIEGYSHKVFISSDGNYAAKLGPWPRLGLGGSRDLNQLVVVFYDKGKLTKEYYIKDLVVDASKLQKSVSHFVFNKELSFNEEENIIRLETEDGSSYVFDMSTGEIVESQRGANVFKSIIYSAVLFAIIVVVATEIGKSYK